MPKYQIDVPGQGTFEVDSPTELSDEQAYSAILGSLNAEEKPQEKSSALRQAADIPVGVARGAVQGVRMIADAFGADNPVSKNLRGVEDYIGGLLSAQAKNDQQEVARIMKEAEDKGVLENVKAGFEAFMVAPADLMAQAFGTAIPTVLGGLAGTALKIAGAARGAGALTGAAMGAGVTKSAIYDAVKEELGKTDLSKEEVERRATLAQEYGGENLDQILLGTGLGAVSGMTGVEKALVPGMVRNVLSKASQKSIAARAATTGGAEFLTEGLQGGQEQVAQNIALQREGFDVPTFRGAVSAGTMEALAGGAMGAGVGAFSRPEIEAPAPKPRPTAPEAAPAAPVAPEPTEAQLRQQAYEQQLAEQEEMLRRAEGQAPAGEFLTPAEARMQRQALAAQQFGLEAPAGARMSEFEAIPGLTPETAQAFIDQDRFQQQTQLPEVTPSQVPARTPTAPLNAEEMRQRIDEQSRLLEAAQLEPFEFDRRRAERAADLAVGTGQVNIPPAAQIVDLTPLPMVQARQKLAVMKDELASAGQDPESLFIVPHPDMPNRFAIEQRALPQPTGYVPPMIETTPISPVEAQGRIETAAQIGQRTAETTPDLIAQQSQRVADQAALNAEQRGGVATPEEAERLRLQGMGRPYDAVELPKVDEVRPLTTKSERERRIDEQVALAKEAENGDPAAVARLRHHQALHGPELWLEGFDVNFDAAPPVRTASPQFEQLITQGPNVPAQAPSVRPVEQYGQRQGLPQEQPYQGLIDAPPVGRYEPEMQPVAREIQTFIGGKYSLLPTPQPTPEATAAAEDLRKKLIPELKKFGLGNVGLKLVDSIENGTADGMYAKQLITLALDTDNHLGVMRHEAVHALRELGAFTQGEWNVLSKAAKDKWIDQFFDKPMQDRYRQVYQEQNGGKLDGFDEFLQEEAVAQAFRFFANNKRPPGRTGNIISRIIEFFRSLRDTLTGRGFQKVDDMFLPERIFADIERGAITPGRAGVRKEGLPKFSVRDYKLDIEREDRKMSKVGRLEAAESDAIAADAEKLQLTPQRVKEIVNMARSDKKRFPASAGWEPLTVIGIDYKTDENKNPIPGTESPKYQPVAYGYAAPPGKTRAPSKIDEQWLGQVEKKFAGLIADIYKRAEAGDKNAKNIIAHQTWYKSVAQTLRREYGAFGDLLADLLGATSPNTPVDTNWNFSIDVFRRFVRGDFNNEMKAFTQHLESGRPMKDFAGEQKIRQLSGKLYGMNSTNAMMALADVWRAIKPGQAPKARNFALNLIGQSDIATIDVWAARMLRRAANMASAGTFKRIPPPAETGVSGTWSADGKRITGEFGFGAEVMRRVSDALKKQDIDVSPPDLQAIAWFAEKELWGSKGWTTKTGEGGSFEENIEKFPVERYVVGHSVQQGEVKPDAQTVMQAKQKIEKLFVEEPGIVSFRVKETKGLYGGTVEEAFDTEFVAEKGAFDPTPLVSAIAQTSQKENQYDFFMSRVVDPDENNPNARPGVELYFKSKMALDNVMPILSEFTSRGVDGFTLALDPRVDDKSGQYIGVRMQFVPEISMRWDEGMREVMNTPDGLQNLMAQKRQQLYDVVAEIAQVEDIAYSAVVDYDTLVVGRENYDAYITPNTARTNIETGKAVWFGQPIRAHVEAAIGRYVGEQTPADSRQMGDTGTARFSLRYFPPESDKSALRPSDDGRAGIAFQDRRPDAATYSGSHYGKAKTAVLNAGLYGTGLKGAESRRLDQSRDPRIKKRVYFYIPRANGAMPNREAGVGNHIYTQKFTNILGPGPSMSALYKQAGGDSNAFESLIVDAGYDGYAVPDYGMMVILNHDVPADYEGTVQEIYAKPAVPKFSLRAPTTAPFKRWFGKSTIVNPDGTPKVMYHGTSRIIEEFIPNKAGAIFVTDNPEFAGQFATDSVMSAATEEANRIGAEYDKLNAKEQIQFLKKAYRLGVKQKAISKREADSQLSLLESRAEQGLFPGMAAFRDVSDFIRDAAVNDLKSGANVLPLYVRAENPFDYENPEHIARLIENADRTDISEDIPRIQNGNWNVIESDSIQDIIKNAGFDGFYVLEGGNKNLAVYNPNQIKSATGNDGTYGLDTGKISYSLKNAPPNRYTKLMENEATAGKKIIDVATSAMNIVRDDGTRTSNRIKLVDKFSGLSRTLESLPLFSDGKLRADMLHHAKAQGVNLIKSGMVTGTPVLNDDGTITIERSENNLARAAYVADKLDNNQNVIDSGMSGRAYVGEIARILRGADIIAEDAETRKLGEQQLREADRMAAELKMLSAQGGVSPTMVANVKNNIDKLRKMGNENAKMKRELQVKPEDIAWAQKQLEITPEVQEVLDIWKNVNTSLVNLWEDAGLLDAETAAKYRAQKNYVPLFKSREDLNEEKFFRSGMGVKTTAKVKKLEGADITRNIWENVDKQYATMIAAAYENQTRRVSVEQMRSIDPDLAEITNATDPRVNLRYRDGGKDVHVVIENPNDLAAFQSATYQMGPIMQFLTGFTKVLRAGALINPMFWIRQLIRDPIHATLTAQTEAITPAHSAAEFFRVITKNSEEAKILADRGVIGQFDSLVSLPEFLESVGKERQKDPNFIQKGIHKLLEIHEASDAATRIAIFKKVKAKALKDGMSEKEATDFAVFKARESINFALMGNSSTLAAARNMIPFLNATIVGLDTLYRAATGYGLNPEERAKARKMFATRAMMMVAFSLAYAFSMQDDEDYQKQPDYVKDGNWLLPIWLPTGKTFIKIPVPYEVGFLFKTLPEVMVRYMSGTSTGKEVIASVRTGFIHNMPTGGVPIPQFAKPALEVVTNYSFFNNRPIEGMGDSRLPVAMRGQRASEFAKMMSGMGLDNFGLSPAKIDVLTKGYFAEMGTFFNELADTVILTGSGREKTSRTVEQLPFMKSFLTDPQVNKAIGDFYQIENAASEVANLYSKYKQEGNLDDLKKLIEDPEKRQQIAVVPTLRRIERQMSTVNKLIRVIDADQNIHPDDRMIRIKDLKQRLAQLAEAGKQVAQSTGLPM